MSGILYSVVLFIHILVCFGVILIVLLQAGKGAGLSSAFGVGGGESFFGGRGPTLFLEKLTTGCAILFMVTCLTLSLLGSKQRSGSIFEKMPITTGAPTARPQSAPVNVPSSVPAQSQAPAVPTVPATPASAPTAPAK
jgi:preprotein translocase subunit SecG